eukprot:COSAG05_NODE_183_length_14758_cov_90.142506_11_plen_99_part_00
MHGYKWPINCTRTCSHNGGSACISEWCTQTQNYCDSRAHVPQSDCTCVLLNYTAGASNGYKQTKLNFAANAWLHGSDEKSAALVRYTRVMYLKHYSLP